MLAPIACSTFQCFASDREIFRDRQIILRHIAPISHFPELQVFDRELYNASFVGTFIPAPETTPRERQVYEAFIADFRRSCEIVR
jgi:hypothetical protein